MNPTNQKVDLMSAFSSGESLVYSGGWLVTLDDIKQRLKTKTQK